MNTPRPRPRRERPRRTPEEPPMRTRRPVLVEPVHVAMTEPELRDLALKIADGRVLGTWDERFKADPQLSIMVFAPLALIDREKLVEQWDRGYTHIYAIIGEDQTMARSINGLPMFAACRFLHRDDAERLQPLIERAVQLRQSFLEP